MCIGVGNARASRAERRGISAVVVVCWNSGGSRVGEIGSAEVADGRGEAGIDEVSVAVVWLLHEHCQFWSHSENREKRTQSGYDQAFASPAMAPKMIRLCMLIKVYMLFNE